MFKSIITTTLLAGAVLANPDINDSLNLLKRQAGCSVDPSVTSVLAGAPTLPADLLTQISGTGCSASFVGSATSEWSSYQSAASSWYSGHSSAVNSLLVSLESSCPAASAVVSAVNSALASVTASCGITGASLLPTATGAGSAAAQTASSTGGAALPTGLGVAGALAAGAMGLIAVL